MAEKNHEKKQEIRADREKFQVETKRENISRVNSYSYFNTLPQKPNFCTYIFLELSCV